MKDTLHLTYSQALDAVNLGLGVYSPLTGFMNRIEIESVVDSARLPAGQPLGLPIVLNLSANQAPIRGSEDEVILRFDGENIGFLSDTKYFEWEAAKSVTKLFRTASREHPGVNRFNSFTRNFLAGRVSLNRESSLVMKLEHYGPAAIRSLIEELGWKTVTGFQTRNIPHRAHEQLLRVGLEISDGLLVQPLVGPRKKGDFTEDAISRGYGYLIENFFPSSRVLFAPLRARMFYGGPREAILHSVIRRNFGCSHFIIGRDHAGVGGFYGKYEAQELALEFEPELGINILALAGPFHCSKCDGYVSEKSCRHSLDLTSSVREISGTAIRKAVENSRTVEAQIIRPGVLGAAQLARSLFEE